MRSIEWWHCGDIAKLIMLFAEIRFPVTLNSLMKTVQTIHRHQCLSVGGKQNVDVSADSTNINAAFRLHDRESLWSEEHIDFNDITACVCFSQNAHNIFIVHYTGESALSLSRPYPHHFWN